jgi:LacI family transcriptional regulator
MMTETQSRLARLRELMAAQQVDLLAVGPTPNMRYLLGFGHRRIGFITGRLELVSAGQRLEGYKESLAEAGILVDDELIRFGDYSIELALAAARSLLELKDRPTAIFGSNDTSAIAVYQVAQEMNLRIPDDLSVIGFDNIPSSAYLNPPLTTVDQFMASMGTRAVEMVVGLIQGKPMETQIQKFDTRLLIRESCSAPRDPVSSADREKQIHAIPKYPVG